MLYGGHHPNLPVLVEQGHGSLAVSGVVDDEVGWVLVLHFLNH